MPDEKTGFCQNPIIRSIYTADPAPMVYDDTLYLFTTHDEDELISDFYTMYDWRCFSTKDMVSFDQDTGVVRVPMTVEAFGKGSHEIGTSYGEGPWFYKRNGIYYMVYAAFAVGEHDEHLAYSTSPSATGPWTYGGVLMTTEGGVFTNHPGIADFKGHSYLFYHTGQLPGGNLFQRSVCVAEFSYNKDGSIDTIAKCDGVSGV